MLRWLGTRINVWVLLGGVLVAGALIALVGLAVVFLPLPVSQARSIQPGLTVIVAPTPTATPTPTIFTPTPTAPKSVGGISVGSYVQITGTEGEGLRLRAGPGTSTDMRFIGMDEEVFLVKGGPKDANGFTWWYLEAPYDPSRSGWAASKYLKVVSPPMTPTP